MDVGEVFAAKDQHDDSANMDIDGDRPPSKKRKTKASTRGVAHLTPEQLAKKRANGTMDKTPCFRYTQSIHPSRRSHLFSSSSLGATSQACRHGIEPNKTLIFA